MERRAKVKYPVPVSKVPQVRAQQLLQQHRQELDTLAQALEREETLDEPQIQALIGPSAYRHDHPRPAAVSAEPAAGSAEPAASGG
jgi:hypothetical protein